MKKIPITNFEKFVKIDCQPYPWPVNHEIIWIVGNCTYHLRSKNNQRGDIEIKWKGNPFELDFDYILEI